MTATDLCAPRFLPQLACETVPRYTSYPPATGFDTATGADSWHDWMEAPKGMMYRGSYTATDKFVDSDGKTHLEYSYPLKVVK